RHRAYPGRPRVEPAVEALVVRFARENTSWGYDRIVGALANLGHHLSDQTVGNILRRHDITPAPTHSRGTTWKEVIRSHMDVLAGRFLHSRGADLERPGNVLRAVLHRIGEPSGLDRQDHQASGVLLDTAGRPQRDARGRRLSERVPLRAARSRQEVLHGLLP